MPTGAHFQFNDGIRDDRGQYKKRSSSEAEIKIGGGRAHETYGVDRPRETTRVKNVVPQTTDELRARYDALLQEPHFRIPSGIVLAWEKEAMHDHAQVRLANEHGGIPHGPKHNPADTLRETVDFTEMPMGSFFVIGAVRPDSRVYLRMSATDGDYVLPVCEYGQWMQGLSTVPSIDLKKEKKLSEILGHPSYLKDLKVTVLSAETPEEFERVLEGRNHARGEAPTEKQAAYHNVLRQQNAKFWEGVRARAEIRDRNRELDLQAHLEQVAAARGQEKPVSAEAPAPSAPPAASADTDKSSPSVWDAARKFFQRRFGQ